MIIDMVYGASLSLMLESLTLYIQTGKHCPRNSVPPAAKSHCPAMPCPL
jgi:hypothetical protein